MAALVIGSATVQELAKKSNLKRTTIYDLLENLKKKGLLTPIKMKRRSYYLAEDPEHILRDLEEKVHLISEALPELKSIKGLLSERPKIYFYEGREGFRRIWKEILESGEKEYLTITSGEQFLDYVSEKYITEKIIQRKVKSGIKSRQLINDSLYARKIIAKDSKENRVSKILPSKFKFPATEIIFGNKIAILSTKFENLLLIIESADIAKTHKFYFEIIWNSLPE